MRTALSVCFFYGAFLYAQCLSDHVRDAGPGHLHDATCLFTAMGDVTPVDGDSVAQHKLLQLALAAFVAPRPQVVLIAVVTFAQPSHPVARAPRQARRRLTTSPRAPPLGA